MNIKQTDCHDTSNKQKLTLPDIRSVSVRPKNTYPIPSCNVDLFNKREICKQFCENRIYNENNISDAIEHCLSIITENKTTNKYYIGATCDPEKRLSDHMKEKQMYNMVLLCKINGKTNTETVEDALISICKNDQYNINKIGGGSGIGGKCNYIYMLLP